VCDEVCVIQALYPTNRTLDPSIPASSSSSASSAASRSAETGRIVCGWSPTSGMREMRELLCGPVRDSRGQIVGVVECVNKIKAEASGGWVGDAGMNR
jgi:hypothetical protein